MFAQLSPYLVLPLAALAWVVIEMSMTFAAARRLRNYGIVDVVWSLGFTPIVMLYVALLVGRGWVPTQWLLVGLVTAWSLRLGGHLFVRVRSHHPVEDVRYARLREEWGADEARRMFGFFLLQGVLQVVLSAPWLLALAGANGARGSVAGFWFPALGTALWIIGWIGESIADRQLANFRNNPANRGRVCQDGLWNHSRHPNYFFEWLIWVGYAVFALGMPWGWLGLIAPALMWHFLVNVTGIPMTEEMSVKSKGDAYRDYQRTTSAFVPWFRRRAPAQPVRAN
jgi:steroid 5-alpha reductase family enzyme